MSNNVQKSDVDQLRKKQKIDCGSGSDDSCIEIVGEIAELSPNNEEMYRISECLGQMEKLKELTNLDEVKSNDEEHNNISYGKSQVVSDEEIEKMLEDKLSENIKTNEHTENTYVKKQKIIFEEKMHSLELLPQDWIAVKHCSGVSLYMHRTTRVCTLSKPFFIGTCVARRCDIPLNAIPCLAYRRALEKEEKQEKVKNKLEKEINSAMKVDNLISDENLFNYKPVKVVHTSNVEQSDSLEAEIVPEEEEQFGKNQSSISVNVMNCSYTAQSVKDKLTDLENEMRSESILGGKPVNIQSVIPLRGNAMPPLKVEMVKAQHLTHEQVTDYCKKLYKFKTVEVLQFKRWVDRRKHAKEQKILQYPTVPEGTRLITIPPKPSNGHETSKAIERKWLVNLSDERNYLSVLNEYVHRAKREQPVYQLDQLQNSVSPFRARVFIGGMLHGEGHGSSKRRAKWGAARAALLLLVPDLQDLLDNPRPAPPAQAPLASVPDLSFVEHVSIEDPRVPDLCTAACEPSPYLVLRSCLRRNFDVGPRDIHTEIKKLKNSKMELTLKVGERSATVVCNNKSVGKQMAAQQLLQGLHPRVRGWGALARLYNAYPQATHRPRGPQYSAAARPQSGSTVLRELRDAMLELRSREGAAQLQLEVPDQAAAPMIIKFG